MGARKGGLGATKVSANFDDIEREAMMAEKLKMKVCNRFVDIYNNREVSIFLRID